MINIRPEFILAGEAVFTVSNQSGTHYTYRVYKTEPSAQYPTPSYFMQYKSGPNEDDFTYMGRLHNLHISLGPTLTKTRNSKISPTADSWRVAQWALQVVWQTSSGKYKMPAGYSIKHEGRCGKCGRALTHPASLDTGIGPDCAASMGIPWAERMEPLPLSGGQFDGPFPSGETVDNIGHPGHPANHGDK